MGPSVPARTLAAAIVLSVIVSFVGGTGPAGYGLAARFAKIGLSVAVGSRSVERAEEAKAMVLERVPNAAVQAAVNAEVIAAGDVVFLTIPFQAQRRTIDTLAGDLAGKIVVSMANPMWVHEGKVWADFPPAGSLAEEVQELVPTARVVGAFHEIHVKKFPRIDKPIHSDTIVTSDDVDGKAIVMDLVRKVEGMRPVDGGALVNTRYVEGFVTVLVQANFNYKAATALRITGLPDEA
ncbi:MAG: NADPH-dependent F420 reductase [Actinomycetota bacterium]